MLIDDIILEPQETEEEIPFIDEEFLIEGTEVALSTGEVFVIDNSMKHQHSCTKWDVYRFLEEGLIKEDEINVR